MKKRYKKEAWFLDDGILIHGYKDKRGFHPEKDLPCGFVVQKINKKTAKKYLFWSLKEAIEKMGEVEIAGGRFVFAIDFGMAITKIGYALICEKRNLRRGINGCYKTRSWLEGYYKTETLVENNNTDPVIKECLNSIGIKNFHNTKIVVAIISKQTKGEIK